MFVLLRMLNADPTVTRAIKTQQVFHLSFISFDSVLRLNCYIRYIHHSKAISHLLSEANSVLLLWTTATRKGRSRVGM